MPSQWTKASLKPVKLKEQTYSMQNEPDNLILLCICMSICKFIKELSKCNNSAVSGFLVLRDPRIVTALCLVHTDMHVYIHPYILLCTCTHILKKTRKHGFKKNLSMTSIEHKVQSFEMLNPMIRAFLPTPL